MSFSNEKIESMIYMINGNKVMLDSDLAKLYGFETKRFIEQVKRNLNRFPEDFLIVCGLDDLVNLRSQTATAKLINIRNHQRRQLSIDARNNVDTSTPF